MLEKLRAVIARVWERSTSAPIVRPAPADRYEPIPGVARVSATVGAAKPQELAIATANLVRGDRLPELVALAANLGELGRHSPNGALSALVASLPTATGRNHEACSAALLLAFAHQNPTHPTSAQIGALVKGLSAHPAGFGNNTAGIGDLQNRLAWLLRDTAPQLFREAVAALPELQAPMPALTQTTNRLVAAHGKPLAGFNTLVIGHVLAEAPGFMRALAELGVERATTRILAVPYSSNELAIEALRADGWNADNPDGKRGIAEKRWGSTVDANVAFRGKNLESFDAMKMREVDVFVQRALADHQANGKPVLVIDDGGFAARVVAERYPDKAHLFRFVEQTTRGIRQIEGAPRLASCVINVAESHVKRDIEGVFVGATIAESLRVELTGVAGVLVGKRIGILGYGAIGSAVAAALRQAGAFVTVYDPKGLLGPLGEGIVPGGRKAEALANQDFVIGCTGLTSLEPDDYRRLKAGVYLVSTSSTDVEYRDSWSNAQSVGEAQKRAVQALLRLPPGAPPPVPPAPGLSVEVRQRLSGSPQDGRLMETEELYDNMIGRTFMDSLNTSFANSGMKVTVKASYGEDPRVQRTMDRIMSIMASAHGPDATPVPRTPAEQARWRDIVDGWRIPLAEDVLALRPNRPPVWLVNGGYPVNLSRRLVSMAPERIQITLAALAAGAVQAALAGPAPAPEVQALDRTFEEWVEADFRAANPTDWALTQKA